MPRIDDLKIKLTEFRRTRYTPWDNSPSPQQNELSTQDEVDILPNDSGYKHVSLSTSSTASKQTKTTTKPVQNEITSGSKQVQTEFNIGLPPPVKPIQNEFKSSSQTSSKTSSTTNYFEPSLQYNTDNLSFLTGSQKKVFLFLLESCCVNGGLISSSINTTELSKLLSIPKDTIKTSIRRLQEKNLIKKTISKQGVGGFLQFKISEEIKLQGVELQKTDLLNRFKSGSDIGSKTGSLNTVVSSSYILNTTTTLPEDLKQIDCSSLDDVGFNESHIIQIHREHMQKPELSLSAEVIQNSINDLAFDLKYNNVANTFKYSPAVVLTSLLKKGQPYSSKTPEKVLTPREEAMKEYLLAQELKKTKTLEMDTKIKDFALQEWLDDLPEEELLEFNKNHPQPDGMSDRVHQTLKKKKALEFAREYFDTILWPKKRNQILNIDKTN